MLMLSLFTLKINFKLFLRVNAITSINFMIKITKVLKKWLILLIFLSMS